MLVGVAVCAGGQPGGEQPTGLVPVDGATALSSGVAVAGVDRDGRTTDVDAEFDDPIRPGWPGAPSELPLRKYFHPSPEAIAGADRGQGAFPVLEPWVQP